MTNFFGDADDNDDVDETDDGTFFGGREYDGIDRLKQSELDIEYLSDGEVMHDTASGKVVFDGDTNASHWDELFCSGREHLLLSRISLALRNGLGELLHKESDGDIRWL